MPDPAENQPAFVLHRRPFRESSALVDLLTRDFGRVAGVLRGARRAGCAHGIEPFGEIAVDWRGRGELATLLRVESAAASVPARLAGDALFAGLYVNELLVKTLAREEPVSALFRNYRTLLARLRAGGDLEPALRAFERHLLEELGYALDFAADIETGRPIDCAGSYAPVDGEGFRAVDASRAASGGEWILSGHQIAAIDAQDFSCESVRRAARRIFRRALERRLGGRTLAARTLFRARARHLHAPAPAR